MAEKSRLTVEIALPVRQRLEAMRDEQNLNSMSEVVENAIALFDLVVQEKKKGNQVLLKNGEKESLIELF